MTQRKEPRTCPRCGERQAVVGRSYCQPCEREYNVRRYEANKDKFLESHRRRYSDPIRREKMLEKNRAWRKANPDKIRAWVEANRDRLRESGARWRQNNPDKRRAQKYAQRYGITVEYYEELLDKQNGVCAICGVNGRRVLHVDHDHATGRIRGLLCSRCNHGIGLFGESVERLRAASRYLKEGQIKT